MGLRDPKLVHQVLIGSLRSYLLHDPDRNGIGRVGNSGQNRSLSFVALVFIGRPWRCLIQQIDRAVLKYGIGRDQLHLYRGSINCQGFDGRTRLSEGRGGHIKSSGVLHNLFPQLSRQSNYIPLLVDNGDGGLKLLSGT